MQGENVANSDDDQIEIDSDDDENLALLGFLHMNISSIFK